ncbi:response regulator [bacterium]|nr:response regulator [bacterium]
MFYALLKKMNKKKILIIEDDEILSKTLQEFLSADGFEVAIALNGEIGIKMAEEKNPDLIVLDIILPKKDGYEVIKELKKESGVAKDIPIILLTNLGSFADVEKALKLGATTYLTKTDYSLEDVAKKIKETLDAK